MESNKKYQVAGLRIRSHVTSTLSSAFGKVLTIGFLPSSKNRIEAETADRRLERIEATLNRIYLPKTIHDELVECARLAAEEIREVES